MTDLPEGWQGARIGDLASTIRGVTYKKSDASSRPGDGRIPLLRATNFGDRVETDSDLVYVPSALVRPEQILKELDLLVATSSGSISVVGKAVAIGEETCQRTFGAFCGVLRPRSGTNAVFVHLYCSSPAVRQLWSDAARGTNINNLKPRTIESTPIPLPPLDEQNEIVRILETQLARIDTVLRSAQAVRDKADQFRRSLLHAAFTGQLTQPDPSREGVPSGWKAMTIADSLETSIGGVWGSEPGTDEVDVDVIRVTELKSHGRIDPSTAARRAITMKQLAGRQLKEGDLLLEKSGGGPKTPVGRVGLVPQLERESVCANFMMLMRADETKVESRLLHLLLNHLHHEGVTVPLQKATTNIRNLKTTEYLQLEIHLPMVHEQPHLLDQLETQLARLDKVLEVADRVEVECGRLRRSLLQAAFTGELTRKWRESRG